jgi:type II secretory pathway predicted ATPase ExeA
MYEAYFGFSHRPFAAAPLANRYFPAASVDAARQMLARCVERGAGAGVLIAPPGTGKSLLLQVLAGQFADKMAAVQLAGGQLTSRRELLQAILFELNLPFRGMEEGELRLALVDHLTRGDKCPHGMLLLVDEAQTLPTLLLEELRMMTNLARGGETRVRLVLAGSMELEELLSGPELQAFSQRLAARCYLEPFDRAETIDYLRFQVAVAGGQAERVFDAAALDAVYRATEGIPRLINQLCDHALLLAYQAEHRPLDAKAIDLAWADLQQLPSPWQHEQAGQRETIEFATLADDELTDDEPAGAIAALASEPSEERVEIDFSADWPSEEKDESHARVQSSSTVMPAARGCVSESASHGRSAPKARARGLRIVEDVEKLQVVVDPYNLDDDDEDEADDDTCLADVEPSEVETHSAEAGDDEQLTCGVSDGAEADAGRQAGPPASVGAGGRTTPPTWEDVAIPAEPVGWSSAPPREAATPLPRGRLSEFTPKVGAAASISPVPVPPGAVTSRRAAWQASTPAVAPEAVRLEEEVVADRYAELDARQPRAAKRVPRPSAGVGKNAIAAKGAVPPAVEAEHEPSLDDSLGHLNVDDLGLEERVTLAEAMRLRLEAEAAAAVARTIAQSPEEQLRLAIDNAPPLPKPEDWLTDSATMMLDPTQMPPSAIEGPADLGHDIVVIDDDAPAPAPAATETVHRVERKDYKTLFAQLRRG